MELLLEHEELRAVLLKYWKEMGVPVSDNAQLIIRCNHKTSTARAVITEKKNAR